MNNEMWIVLRVKNAMIVSAMTPKIKYKQPLPNVSNRPHAPLP